MEFHMQFLQVNVENQSDFARALALEPRRRDGHDLPRHGYWPKSLLYSEHVRYVEQLTRYLAVFAPEQVHVIIYEDFRADNAGTVRQILRFLDVDDDIVVAPVQANPTVRARSQLLNEVVHAVGVGRGPFSRTVKESIKLVTPEAIRRNAFHAVRERVVFAEPSEPDERTLSELRVRLKPEVLAFSEYLQRDLVRLWGYDSVD